MLKQMILMAEGEDNRAQGLKSIDGFGKIGAVRFYGRSSRVRLSAPALFPVPGRYRRRLLINNRTGLGYDIEDTPEGPRLRRRR
jgi:hypothetical protein